MNHWTCARHYRQYRHLAPLWNELHRAFPQDALTRVPSSPWLERITPRGVDRRYYRRVIECRYGLVRISPPLMVPGSPQPLADRLLTALRIVPAAREAPEDTVAVAVAVPSSAGLDADARELVALARQLAATRRRARSSAGSSSQRQENT